MIQTFSVGREDMKALAEKVLELVENKADEQAVVIHLEGDLGTGKTTLSQEFARLIGVQDIVISPTFVLKKVYEANHETIKTLVHIDAYRFTSKEEGRALALEYDHNPGTAIIIEWPGQMEAPSPDVHVLFEYQDENTRKVTLTSYGSQ